MLLLPETRLTVVVPRVLVRCWLLLFETAARLFAPLVVLLVSFVLENSLLPLSLLYLTGV